MAKQQKKQKCAYCGDRGWDKKWMDLGYHVSCYSPLFTERSGVYQCWYCDLPENAPKAPRDERK